ncbi:MAG: glycosyltransferase family 87 protein [Chloroflexota bacterium]
MRRTVIIVYFFGSLLLIGVYGLIWSSIVQNPADAVNRDFLSFAIADYVIERHGYLDLYDIGLQSSAMTAIVEGPILLEGSLLPFVHPPFLMPVMVLFINEDPFGSFLRWTLATLMLLIPCIWLSHQFLKQKNIAEPWWILIPLFLLAPLHINLFQGQDLIFLLFGLLVFVWGVDQDNDLIGGMGLSLTTISPHLAVLFAIPLFFSNRKLFAWFCAFAAILVSFSLFLIGFDGLADFLNIIRVTAAAEGSSYGVNKVEMFNLIGLSLRLWPTMPIHLVTTITWSGYALAILLLCRLHAKTAHKKSSLLLTVSLSINVALFFAPHLHAHSLLPLWIVFLIWGMNRVQIKKSSSQQVGLWVLLASLAMVPIFVPVVPLSWIGVFVVLIICAVLTLQQLNFK